MNKRDWLILTLWSTVVASIIIFLNLPESKEYLSYSFVRVGLLQDFMDMIQAGQVPQFLSATEHSWGFAFYLPYLAVALGITEAWKIVLGIHMTAMWILLVVFPLEIAWVTRNKTLAFLSPVLLHVFCGNVLYGYKIDTIWAAGWVIIITLPLLYQFYKVKDRRKEAGLIAAIGILCSCGNVMRNHCGFYTTVVLLIIICAKILISKKKLIGIAWYFILTILFAICSAVVDQYIPLFVGWILNLDIINNSGFIWHALLCGMGNYDNIYGLKCEDGVIIALITGKYPAVEVYSNEYLIACKNEFFQILTSDPLFVIGTWFKTFLLSLQRLLAFQFTSQGNEDYFFGAVKYNVQNISIPAILGTGSYVAVKFIKWKRKMRLHLKRDIFWLLLAMTFVITGTVQAVFLIAEIRYFLPSFVGTGTLFLVLSMMSIRDFCDLKESDYG